MAVTNFLYPITSDIIFFFILTEVFLCNSPENIIWYSDFDFEPQLHSNSLLQGTTHLQDTFSNMHENFKTKNTLKVN